MKRTILIHPYLFTLISVLFLYFSSSTTISPTEMLRPLAWMLFFLTLLIYPAYLLTKDWDLTGILLAIFVFGFYYEEVVFLFVVSNAIIILILWFLFSKIRTKKMEMNEATLLLNLLSIILVVGGAVKLAIPLIEIPNSYYQKIRLTAEQIPIAAIKSRQMNPDIYYIVLDGYARSDILKNLYGYDNSDFISYLREQDFIVPTDNHSNYPKTSLSIPSTLNMDYIQTLTPGLDESRFWWLMSPLINHSQTRIMLETIGYETVSLSVDWTITNNKTTDIYYQPSSIQISEFEKYLLHNTPLAITLPLLGKIAYIPTSNPAHREMVLYDFEQLSQISKLSGAQFIFAHIISPHPPFIFDQNGNESNFDKPFSFNDGEGYKDGKRDFASLEERSEKYREGYIEQVQFVNGEIKKVIDNILKNSETPPIIIIQADHGSGLLSDFSSSENTCLHERFSPFAAYYLPNLDEEHIPSDISSVNLFRIIFNEYFDARLPLLENAYYFSKDSFYVYDMEKISLERINTPCETQP